MSNFRKVKDSESLADAALNEILARGAPILGSFSNSLMISNSISLDEFIGSHSYKSFLGTLDHFLKTTKISDWMADVPDDTKLIHMNLPGTHDTCTCKYFHTLPTFMMESNCEPYRELYFGNPKIFGAIYWTVRV
jgi:hypothetical protein